jgi:hypothetical protein
MEWCVWWLLLSIRLRLLDAGFYGEAVAPDCGCTAVQKTHGFALEGLVPVKLAQRTAEVKLFRGRGILLLRNPYEALLSYRNFLYGGHTGFAPHSQFKGPGNARRDSATCHDFVLG